MDKVGKGREGKVEGGGGRGDERGQREDREESGGRGAKDGMRWANVE